MFALSLDYCGTSPVTKENDRKRQKMISLNHILTGNGIHVYKA